MRTTNPVRLPRCRRAARILAVLVLAVVPLAVIASDTEPVDAAVPSNVKLSLSATSGTGTTTWVDPGLRSIITMPVSGKLVPGGPVTGTVTVDNTTGYYGTGIGDAPQQAVLQLSKGTITAAIENMGVSCEAFCSWFPARDADHNAPLFRSEGSWKVTEADGPYAGLLNALLTVTIRSQYATELDDFSPPPATHFDSVVLSAQIDASAEKYESVAGEFDGVQTVTWECDAEGNLTAERHSFAVQLLPSPAGLTGGTFEVDFVDGPYAYGGVWTFTSTDGSSTLEGRVSKVDARWEFAQTWMLQLDPSGVVVATGRYNQVYETLLFFEQPLRLLPTTCNDTWSAPLTKIGHYEGTLLYR